MKMLSGILMVLFSFAVVIALTITVVACILEAIENVKRRDWSGTGMITFLVAVLSAILVGICYALYHSL